MFSRFFYPRVVIVPRRAAKAMLAAANELTRIEEAQVAELATGGDRQTIYEACDRFGHIRKWVD